MLPAVNHTRILFAPNLHEEKILEDLRVLIRALLDFSSNVALSMMFLLALTLAQKLILMLGSINWEASGQKDHWWTPNSGWVFLIVGDTNIKQNHPQMWVWIIDYRFIHHIIKSIWAKPVWLLWSIYSVNESRSAITWTDCLIIKEIYQSACTAVIIKFVLFLLLHLIR